MTYTASHRSPWGGRPRIYAFGLVLAMAGALGASAGTGVEPKPGPPGPARATEGAGDSEAAPRGGGSLVIAGGGALPDRVYDRFLELAGGRKARIVVIPTARWPGYDKSDPNRDLRTWTSRGVASARVLHTRSRAEADGPGFAGPLAEATGVWIGGGSQSRLSEAYAGTEVERQLKALLDRGGVIGGSSAGAAIMTRVMIRGGEADPVEGRGFDFLPGAVVDQHFLKRNRVGRLTRMLERHPGLVGFGIDESTALVVDVRGHKINVVGDSCVVACLPGRFEILKPGDEWAGGFGTGGLRAQGSGLRAQGSGLRAQDSGLSLVHRRCL